MCRRPARIVGESGQLHLRWQKLRRRGEPTFPNPCLDTDKDEAKRRPPNRRDARHILPETGAVRPQKKTAAPSNRRLRRTATWEQEHRTWVSFVSCADRAIIPPRSALEPSCSRCRG